MERRSRLALTLTLLVSLGIANASTAAPPRSLTEAEVECDERTLDAVANRLLLIPPNGLGSGITYTDLFLAPGTTAGTFSGVGFQAVGGPEQVLSFEIGIDRELPLDPERMIGRRLELRRLEHTSNLVVPTTVPGADRSLRMTLDSSERADGTQHLAINNLSAGPTENPPWGDSVGPLPPALRAAFRPCHAPLSEQDREIILLLQRIVLTDLRQEFFLDAHITVFRGAAPGVFRMNIRGLDFTSDVVDYGKLALELRIDRGPHGEITKGSVRLLPRCHRVAEANCTDATFFTGEIDFVPPIHEGVEVRHFRGGFPFYYSPGTTVSADWGRLLAETAWSAPR